MATKPKDTKDAAWAKRIAALMDAANIDADELAARMRINRSTAYHWRNGTRIPSRDLQPKLAKCLGISVAELNGWAA
jgi:transcriptional regulator with XRE-family HTH domain